MRKAARTKKATRGASQRFEDVQWLNEVREVRHPLDSDHPIFVREVSIASGAMAPQPTAPFPERHPFCEFHINLKGFSTQLIAGEKVERKPGDIMLLGPGVPHYAFRHSYPHHTISIFFLPLVRFEMGPRGDGAWLLSRFTARQLIGQRVISPPRQLKLRLLERSQEIAREFRNQQPGSELRLWGMFAESLVDLLRWEIGSGRWIAAESRPQDWALIEKALHYLHEHYAESIYVDQVASMIGVTPDRLRDTFRETLNMSCSHYIQSLRISQAKSRLCLPDAQITEVALSVGFETLSHFNTSFRKLTGLSPSQFIRTLAQ
jgi:AraC-like DNA-binding protein